MGQGQDYFLTQAPDFQEEISRGRTVLRMGIRNFPCALSEKFAPAKINWRRRRRTEECEPMNRLIATLLITVCTASCDDKPAPSATAAANAKDLFIVEDWKDWKKVDTAGEEKVEVKPDIPEPNAPKDAKRPELPAEAKKAGVLILGSGEPFSEVRYEGKADILPREGYEISWDGMRVEGSDFFSALVFPVGPKTKEGKDRCVSFVAGGWGGMVVGISAINHQYASENESTRSHEFQNGRWYRFTLQVTPEVIRCLIDGKELFKVDIRDKQLSMHVSEIQSCEPLGFSSYQTTGAIRNVQIRKLKRDEVKPDPVEQ